VAGLTRAELLQFMRSHAYAVQASVSAQNAAQAALIGIAVSDSLEIIFDSIDTTRKVGNLGASRRFAFVIGGWVPGDERTVQYEGVVDIPGGDKLERLKAVYYGAFPGGRLRLKRPGLVYLRARPTWIRYSNFNAAPAVIEELDEQQIQEL
jgi:hypothetical protein